MAESLVDKSDADINLLYPELLTRDDLITILKQRYVNQPELDKLNKESLLELHYKYVLPLPQRKYRLNRRGRDMTKKQTKLAKKRKILYPDEGEPPLKKVADSETNTRLLSSFEDPSSQSRLKPPPSCIDYSKKKISLRSPTEKSSCTSEVVPMDTDQSSTKKKFTPITFTLSDSSSESTTKIKKVTSPVIDQKCSNNSIQIINKHLSDRHINKSRTQNKHDSDQVEKTAFTKIKQKPGGDLDKQDEISTVKEITPRKKIKLKRL